MLIKINIHYWYSNNGGGAPTIPNLSDSKKGGGRVNLQVGMVQQYFTVITQTTPHESKFYNNIISVQR